MVEVLITVGVQSEFHTGDDEKGGLESNFDQLYLPVSSVGTDDIGLSGISGGVFSLLCSSLSSIGLTDSVGEPGVDTAHSSIEVLHTHAVRLDPLGQVVIGCVVHVGFSFKKILYGVDRTMAHRAPCSIFVCSANKTVTPRCVTAKKLYESMQRQNVQKSALQLQESIHP